jgi:mono/diheme cytochrome c family protein
MIILGSAGMLAAAAIGAAVWTQRPLTSADHTDARWVAHGQKIYVQHCASCHGANLEGQPEWWKRNPNGRLPAPPHDATGHTWHHSDRVLFNITKEGLGAGPDYETDMPIFDAILTDQDIWAVLAYIKSTWPADILAKQPKPQPAP